MANTITIRVHGTPRPKGSKRPFSLKNKAQQIVGFAMVEQGGENLKDWMALIQAAAMEAYDGPMLTCAVEVNITYLFARPKSHYGTGRNAGKLKASAPMRHITRPDRDKLDRAVHDALHNVLYKDDSQSDIGQSCKQYAEGDERPGALIQVTPAEKP